MAKECRGNRRKKRETARLRFYLLALLLPWPALAQPEPTWRLGWALDNDRFGNWQDRDYSFGNFITLTQPRQVKGAAAALQFTHIIEGYTNDQPEETPDQLSRDDHPYAGYQGLRVELAWQESRGQALEGGQADYGQSYGLEVGLVGPSSRADVMQWLTHDLTGTVQYKAWDSQLPNEAVLNLYTRQELDLRFDATSRERLSATPYLEASLGNKLTHLGGGLDVAYGSSQPLSPSVASTVRRAQAADDQIGWAVYSAIRTRYVFHDIFLDGTLFSEAPHTVTRNPFVFSAEAGLELVYGDWRAGWRQIHQAKRFLHQTEAQRFGRLYIDYAF